MELILSLRICTAIVSLVVFLVGASTENARRGAGHGNGEARDLWAVPRSPQTAGTPVCDAGVSVVYLHVRAMKFP